jgi:GMP synthase-like glutamine amidotransferase
MNVLILKNIANEGPGTMEDFLHAEAIPFSVVEMHAGERSGDPDRFTHLVVMGGPMAVYEMERHPFLKEEAALIERFILSNRHVLGVCLGAQLVAHVLGAKVYPGSQKEIGWYEVALSPEGMSDPLMSALSLEGTSRAEVFQWHGDTFDLPEGSVRLASSDIFPNQAFRYSRRVYALQFHIEVTPVIVAAWLEHEQSVDLPKVKAESKRVELPYSRRALEAYRRFFVES